MGYFDKNKKRDGGRGKGSRDFGGGGKRKFDDRRSGGRKMFDAVCDKCGRDCQVPFRPTQGKPVYCKECFGKGGRPGGREGGHRGGHKGGQKTENYARQFDILNSKLDRILRAVGDAPVEKKKPVEIAEKKPEKKKAPAKKTKAAPKKTKAKKVTKKAVKKVVKKKAAPKKKVAKKKAPAKKAKPKAKKK